MQSHGTRLLTLQNRSSAVFPETDSIHPKLRQTHCRYFVYACLVVLTLALSVAANGQGIVAPGTLSFSPASVNFGSVATGTSHTISLTIKNTGIAPVTISGESVHATGFSLSGLTVPHAISGGGSVVLSVKFAPMSAGLFSGYILFTGNAANSSVQCPVSGTGVTPATVSATPSSVSFGTVVNGTTNSQTVQLKNTGGTSLTISSATVSGTGFTISGITVPLTLAASQTKSFTVAFGPTASGSVTGSVTIKSNASNPTYTMALSGTGGSATRTISLSTSNLNFGNEVVGGSIPLGVAVKNSGNSSLTISQIAVTGTGFSVLSGIRANLGIECCLRSQSDWQRDRKSHNYEQRDQFAKLGFGKRYGRKQHFVFGYAQLGSQQHFWSGWLLCVPLDDFGQLVHANQFVRVDNAEIHRRLCKRRRNLLLRGNCGKLKRHRKCQISASHCSSSLMHVPGVMFPQSETGALRQTFDSTQRAL